MAQDPQAEEFVKYEADYWPRAANKSINSFDEIRMSFVSSDAFYKITQSCLGKEYKVFVNNNKSVAVTKGDFHCTISFGKHSSHESKGTLRCGYSYVF